MRKCFFYFEVPANGLYLIFKDRFLLISNCQFEEILVICTVLCGSPFLPSRTCSFILLFGFATFTKYEIKSFHFYYHIIYPSRLGQQNIPTVLLQRGKIPSNECPIYGTKLYLIVRPQS